MELGKEFMKYQLEQKKLFDRFKINYLTDIDKDVCDYVFRNLSSMNIGNFDYGRKIDKLEMVNIGLAELSIFGEEIFTMARDIILRTPIVSDDLVDPIQLATAVSFIIDDSNNIDEDSGKVSKFVVPKDIYEISGLFFGHEQIHGMKDTNYKEYVNIKTLGEVIPIFYELIIYNPNNVIKNNLLKIRMSSIFENSYEYALFNHVLNTEVINKLIGVEDSEQEQRIEFYKFAALKMGCYLNSFYYALILYNMYKETPKKILKIVSMVLKHEITTLEMLQKLGIYGDIRGELFEKEIHNIRKLVK